MPVNFISKGCRDLEILHQDLNIFVKFSVSAIDHLKSYSSSEEELKDKIDELIIDAGERWTASRYNSPSNRLDITRLQITKSGIMWVYSAFEVYLNFLQSFCDLFLTPVSSDGVIENKAKIESIFNKYGWNYRQLDFMMPLLLFYTEARHCIVHNMGKANKTMIDLLRSEKFARAMENWPTVKADKKLSLPPVILEDGQILFNPHHAITYSDICLRIAIIVDELIFSSISLRKLTVFTVEKHLLKETELPGPIHQNVYKYIKHKLYELYNLRSLKDEQIKKMLEDNDILEKSKHKYRTLKALHAPSVNAKKGEK